MRRPLGAALTTLALAVGLLAGTGATDASAERAASTLTVTPDVFVGGQALRFVGQIDGAPNAKLRIETLTNRPGDEWNLRDEIVATTDGQGHFDFEYPGPSNFGIKYRVRTTTNRTSPAALFEPRQQEVVLSLDGGPEQAPGSVVSGADFTIDVDTTPTGRGNLGRPAPPFPGRELALQQRVRVNQWKTVASAQASETGAAQFTLTAGAPGLVAYRIRQDDILTGANEIGWFPSFPLEVTVVAPGGARPAAAVGPIAPAGRPAATGGASYRSPGATPLASQRYQWGPTEWDFAWLGGESLTSPPYRGRTLTGRWIDASDGSGRAAHYNGGLALSSNISEFPGDGDHGTTTLTLQGNPLTYGRWEFRRRIDVFENVGPDYRVLIELVPEKAKDDHCGANTITVADVTFDATKAKLGVSSRRAKRTWKGSRSIPRLGDGPHSFGIEVMRDHITWFLDGESLATVKSKKAAPGVALTPRLSLVGRGQQEMRRTRVLYDWQRAWRLNKQAKKSQPGAKLKAKKLKGAC
ncbi:hypothetical protein [Nocardioides sp.]|uniref:hypothetical protein n=2 Tax=Nocardioides sp. TaxID=35761 RepID=UPI000C925243|nr:hypothetical protein [Pimelobacter sp.]